MILRHLYVCYRKTYRKKTREDEKIRVAAIMQKGSYRRMRGTKLLKPKVTNKKGRDFPAQLYLKTFGRRDLLLFFFLS